MARRALLRDTLPLMGARVALPDLGWGDARELGRSTDLLAMAAPWLTDALTWGYVPGARVSPAEFLARISSSGACHGVRVVVDNGTFAPTICGGAAMVSGGAAMVSDAATVSNNTFIGAVWGLAATNNSEPQLVAATYKIKLVPSTAHVNAEIVGGDMASYTLFLAAIGRLKAPISSEMHSKCV